MNATVNYTPWPEVAATLGIRDIVFERWIKYGYVTVVRNGDGLLVITDNEQERLKRILRIARISNIAPKKVFEWINEGSVTAIRIGGQWVELSKNQVGNPPDMVFTPSPFEETTGSNSEPALPVKQVAAILKLSLVYLQRWINYKYISAFRDENGVLMLRESEIRRNVNLGELAEYCNIGRNKIHGWISEGTVSGIRIGKVELEISRLRVDSPYKHDIQPIKRYPKP